MIVDEVTPSAAAPTPKALDSPSVCLNVDYGKDIIVEPENSGINVQMNDAVMDRVLTKISRKNTMTETKSHANLVNAARLNRSDEENALEMLDEARQNVNTNHRKENRNALSGDAFHRYELDRCVEHLFVVLQHNIYANQGVK